MARSSPKRTGARHAYISPYGPYAARGGQVCLGNEREWAVLCERVLHRPDLVTDPRFATNPDRSAHDGELTVIIEMVPASTTPDEVVALLDETGIASARLRTPAEFAGHPQLAGSWREIDTPAGPVRALLPPVTVPGREAAMGAVPALGQHTDSVLAEFRPASSTRPVVSRDHEGFPAWIVGILRDLGRAMASGRTHTVRSASVGERRAARIAG